MLRGQYTSNLFFLMDRWQTLRHWYLVGSPNCRQVVGTAEYKPNSSETLCTLRFAYLTWAATFFFFLLLQRSLLQLLSFLLCVQGSCFPRGEVSAAGRQRAIHAPKSLPRSAMPCSRCWKPEWKEEATSNRMKKRLSWSRYSKHRRKCGEWREKPRGRRDEPSLCFGDSKDAGLVLTVCWDDTIPLQFGATETHLKKPSLDYWLKKTLPGHLGQMADPT